MCWRSSAAAASAAHERPPLDGCDVTEIVARNATIARYSGERSIAFSFPAQPHLVLANRVILSQVIGNCSATPPRRSPRRGRRRGPIAVDHRERAGGDDRIRDDGEGFGRPEVGRDACSSAAFSTPAA